VDGDARYAHRMGTQRDDAGRQAAFFDLDKTVVARSSTLAFGKELYREGLLSRAIIAKGAYAQLVYQLLGANEERMERSRVQLLELTKGWEAERVQRLVRETLQEVIDPLVYAEALELFDVHRRAGRDLYLVSASGVEIVRPLAEYLGVPHVIATISGIDDDGRYDGTLDFYCYGEEKAVAIRAEAEARGLDLAGSYAYSDSVTDVPMLAAVGHPVAVNPDRELRAHAEAEGWEVRDFARPVALRSRLSQVPRPPTEVVAGAGALGIAGLAAWAVYQRVGGGAPTRSHPAEVLAGATARVTRRRR
jgi:HAD superfamily hydrolase (TIGR01490 family)